MARLTAVAKRRTPLTRDRVLRAAIALADETGLEAVTMRRLGQELGVEAMSLYNHVANKDDLLDGIVDLVLGDIEIPPSGTPWPGLVPQVTNGVIVEASSTISLSNSATDSDVLFVCTPPPADQLPFARIGLKVENTPYE